MVPFYLYLMTIPLYLIAREKQAKCGKPLHQMGIEALLSQLAA